MIEEIRLCDINTCTQCHACEEVCPKHCISFTQVKDGFAIPVIDQNLCIQCKLCINSCHQISNNYTKKKPLHAYAAWSTNDAIRRKSSSGGVFTEIARYIFERNGVVFGSVMNEKLKVIHSMAESMEQLAPMRGSKYVQSDMTGIYPQIREQLKSGRLVLFSGTPCQVAGLYSFLKKNYDNLLTCDLVCHGVPSQKALDTYCEKIGLSSNNITEVSFRYTKGWGFQMAIRSKSVLSSKERGCKWKNISPRNSYYLRAFTRGLMFNETCYRCHYSTEERVSDITMADYWGIGTERPFNHSTSKGVSLLLANSKKGHSVISECKKLFTEERTITEAIAGNHNLSHSSERPHGRDTYYEDAKNMEVKNILKKYGLTPSLKDYLRPIKRFFMSK